MGRGPSKPLVTHVRREIMHAQWEILLDDEFLQSYAHGIVIEGDDGIKRRFYPRIFTYSADYPEKSVMLHLYLSTLLTFGLTEYSLPPFAPRAGVPALVVSCR